MYEEFTFEIEEVHDLGNGVTFCVISQCGRLADTAAWIPEERSARAKKASEAAVRKRTAARLAKERAARLTPSGSKHGRTRKRT